MKKGDCSKGFTLIEILIVVALIAILAAVTIVALNPGKSFADTRNATRSSDVRTILNAMTQYAYEEGHAVSDFGSITACASGSDAIGTAVGNINISALLVDEYVVGIPEDPTTGSTADTGYTVCVTAGGRIQIEAPDAENSVSISVSR